MGLNLKEMSTQILYKEADNMKNVDINYGIN
jgi:hypothetical protein